MAPAHPSVGSSRSGSPCSPRSQRCRGSGGSTVDGGGHGWPDSQRRSDRAFGSSARRNDSAVDPVRGRLSPISGGVDRLVVNLRMTPVPILDLQPRPQQPGDEHRQDHFTEFVERRLVVRPRRRDARDLRGTSRRRSRSIPFPPSLPPANRRPAPIPPDSGRLPRSARPYGRNERGRSKSSTVAGTD